MSKVPTANVMPLHECRRMKARSKRRLVSKSRKPVPARQYPPGFFTAPVTAWTQLQWRPGFWAERVAAYLQRVAPNAPTLNQGRPSSHMTAEREKRASEGVGWGSANLALPGTPHMSTNIPGWMGAPR